MAWAIAEVQYGESIAAARALVAANLSLPTAWASGAQVQRVGEGGQGGYCGWRVKKIECCKTSARIEEKKENKDGKKEIVGGSTTTPTRRLI